METEIVTQYGVFKVKYYCDDVGMRHITSVTDTNGNHIDVAPELLNDIFHGIWGID